MAETQTQTIPEVRAQAKWVHCSARKARLVLDTIRGRSVPEARTVLAFSTRDVARDINKVLRSAVANAEQKQAQLDVDDLVIRKIFVDKGPQERRIRPAPMGRAFRVLHRKSHLTIELSDGASEAKG